MQPPLDELRLFEYGELSDPVGITLFERRQAVQEYLNKSWLTPSFHGEQGCLRATHYVGLLPFRDNSGTHLLMIAPKGCCRQNWKDGLLRFLELVALGHGEMLPKEPPGWEGQSGAHQFLLFLAYHYAGLLKELCLRDFRSYYRPEEDELRSRIRGRLHLAGYARLSVRGKPHILPCRWDEFTVDNWDNRILWAAARRLKQLAARVFDSEAAAWVWQPFNGLLPWFNAVAELPITVHDLHKSRLGKTSRYYRQALAWAELLIRGSDVPTAGGIAPPLVFNSNTAFEKFAVVVVRDALPDADWRCDPQQPWPFLRGKILQDRKPDLLLSDSRGVRGVADAKYKDVLERVDAATLETGDEKALHTYIQKQEWNQDWNQLYVYMRITGAPCGFFLVPFWNAAHPPIAWLPDIRFEKSPCDGNVRVVVLGLNLLQPLQQVKKAAAHRLRSWLSESR